MATILLLALAAAVALVCLVAVCARAVARYLRALAENGGDLHG